MARFLADEITSSLARELEHVIRECGESRVFAYFVTNTMSVRVKCEAQVVVLSDDIGFEDDDTIEVTLQDFIGHLQRVL
ncbi:MAG: hypothetical protein AAF196_01030 [Planctomycetota bacterium]